MATGLGGFLHPNDRSRSRTPSRGRDRDRDRQEIRPDQRYRASFEAQRAEDHAAEGLPSREVDETSQTRRSKSRQSKAEWSKNRAPRGEAESDPDDEDEEELHTAYERGYGPWRWAMPEEKRPTKTEPLAVAGYKDILSLSLHWGRDSSGEPFLTELQTSKFQSQEEQDHMKWLHIQEQAISLKKLDEVIEKEEFLDLSSREERLASRVVDRVRNERERQYPSGLFCEPGALTYVSKDILKRTPDQTSSFISFPYFLLDKAISREPILTPEKKHPLRSLLQTHFRLEPSIERDISSQCITKLDWNIIRAFASSEVIQKSKSVKSLIWVPQLFCLCISNRFLVTYGPIALDDLKGKSVTVKNVEESAPKPNSTGPTVLGMHFYHDLKPQRMIFPLEQCNSYFGLKNKKYTVLNAQGVKPYDRQHFEIYFPENGVNTLVDAYTWPAILRDQHKAKAKVVSVWLFDKRDSKPRVTTQDVDSETTLVESESRPLQNQLTSSNVHATASSEMIPWSKPEENTSLGSTSRFSNEHGPAAVVGGAQQHDSMPHDDPGIGKITLQIAMSHKNSERIDAVPALLGWKVANEDGDLEKASLLVRIEKIFQSVNKPTSAKQAAVHQIVEPTYSVNIDDESQEQAERISNSTGRCRNERGELYKECARLWSCFVPRKDMSAEFNDRKSFFWGAVIPLVKPLDASLPRPTEDDLQFAIQEVKEIRKKAEKYKLAVYCQSDEQFPQEILEDPKYIAGDAFLLEATVEAFGALINMFRAGASYVLQQPTVPPPDLKKPDVGNSDTETPETERPATEEQANRELPATLETNTSEQANESSLMAEQSTSNQETSRAAVVSHTPIKEPGLKESGFARYAVKVAELLKLAKARTISDLNRPVAGQQLGTVVTPEEILIRLLGRLSGAVASNGTYDLIQMYSARLHVLELEVRRRQNRYILLQLYEYLAELRMFYDILNEQREVLIMLRRNLNPKTYKTSSISRRIYFESESQAIKRVLKSINKNREDCRDLRQRAAQLAQCNLESVEALQDDNNKAILVFTIFTVFFLPLSFVAGFYGMNFEGFPSTADTIARFYEVSAGLTAVIFFISCLCIWRGEKSYFWLREKWCATIAKIKNKNGK